MFSEGEVGRVPNLVSRHPTVLHYTTPPIILEAAKAFKIRSNLMREEEVEILKD